MAGRLLTYLQRDDLAVGQETMPRGEAQTAGAPSGSGSVRLVYFTARRDLTVSQVRMTSGTTAAGATPTLVRIGLYTVAGDGSLTLVAATANDTTLFASTTTEYTKSFASPYMLRESVRYAVGVLVVTVAASPTYAGGSVPAGVESGKSPRMTGVRSGQTDLPASIAVGDIGDSFSRPYAALLP